MIEMEIPKDVRKYEAKLVGPFTTRQTICFVSLAIISVIAYQMLKNVEVVQDEKFFIIMVLVLPFILVGWVKPYGMPFEQFLKTMFVSTFISPKYRRYVTKNYYSNKTSANIKINRKKDAKLASKRKQSKDYISYS